MATNKKREILTRAYLGFALIFLLGTAIVGRALYIQTAKGDYYRNLADSLTIFPQKIQAERGNIYSVDGRLMATTLPTFDLRIDFKTTYQHPEIFRSGLDSVALLLTEMFRDKSVNDYKAELTRERRKKSRYYLLKRNVSYNQLTAIKNWPWFRDGQYKSGLIAIQNDKRLMPFGLLAQRTIGFTNKAGGQVGLEKTFDGVLKGEEGQVLVQRIAGGVTIPLDSREQLLAKPGRDIYTTLDLELQDVAEDALMRALQHHAADHGCVVLMEVKTGRIKAIANLGLIKDSTYGEILNYAVGEASEPGSTFKLATAAALIEDGLVDNSSLVFVGDGKFAVRNRVIADHDKPESAEITFQRAFEVSSNVAMAALADKHYNAFKEKLYKHFENFGFTKAIDVELPGAATPLLRDVKQWSGVSAAYLAHGYELAITPLHTLMFYNAIANNGVMVAPHIVDRVREYNTTLDSTETRVINSEVCSPKTIQSLRKLLEGVVENGTARNLKTDYLRVAGKTGTAVVSQGKGGYNNSGRKIYRASFCGYFPVDDPQYSMIVMINSPSANGYYGNVVAGTIFKEVADKVYSMNIQMHRAVNRDSATVKKLPVVAKGSADDLKKVYAYLGKNVSDVSGWIQVTNEADNINTSEIEMYNQLVPDVTGFSMKDALYLLEGMGLKTVVNGYGHVVQQSVAGVPAVKGMVVQLDFK